MQFKSLLARIDNRYRVQGSGFQWAGISKTFNSLSEAEKWAKDEIKRLEPKGLTQLDIFDASKEEGKSVSSAFEGFVKTIRSAKGEENLRKMREKLGK